MISVPAFLTSSSTQPSCCLSRPAFNRWGSGSPGMMRMRRSFARVEEIRLAKAIAAGDDVARQQLFETHLRLVPCMAMRRMRLGASWADLIEAGNRGLVQAIENFDYRKGFSFSKYAAWWVRRAMTGVITRQPPNPNVIPGTIPLATIGDVLDGLTPRQRRILQLRFGLTDGHARPREKVGNASASLPSAWARSS